MVVLLVADKSFCNLFLSDMSCHFAIVNEERSSRNDKGSQLRIGTEIGNAFTGSLKISVAAGRQSACSTAKQ